jgi:methionine salvage enolase-phosphatase E1
MTEYESLPSSTNFARRRRVKCSALLAHVAALLHNYHGASEEFMAVQWPNYMSSRVFAVVRKHDRLKALQSAISKYATKPTSPLLWHVYAESIDLIRAVKARDAIRKLCDRWFCRLICTAARATLESGSILVQ